MEEEEQWEEVKEEVAVDGAEGRCIGDWDDELREV